MMLDDYSVPERELSITCQMPIASHDLSGENSTTDNSFQGIKAKILQVKFIIPFEKTDELSALMQIAEATEKGDLKKYAIVDPTADAMNINQVQFYENVKVRQLDDINAWRIVFKLKEHISTAEKAAEREASSTGNSPNASTENTTAEPGTNTGTPPAPENLPQGFSTFEKLLNYLEEKLEALEEQEDAAQ